MIYTTGHLRGQYGCYWHLSGGGWSALSQASQPVWMLQTVVWIDVRSRQSIRPTEGAAVSVGLLCQWMGDLSETGTVATVQPINQSISQWTKRTIRDDAWWITDNSLSWPKEKKWSWQWQRPRMFSLKKKMFTKRLFLIISSSCHPPVRAHSFPAVSCGGLLILISAVPVTRSHPPNSTATAMSNLY